MICSWPGNIFSGNLAKLVRSQEAILLSSFAFAVEVRVGKGSYRKSLWFSVDSEERFFMMVG